MKIVSKLFLSCLKYILPLVAGYTTLAQPKGFDVLDYHYVDNTDRLISATAFSVLNTEDRVITAGYTGRYKWGILAYSNYISVHDLKGNRKSHKKIDIPNCWASVVTGNSNIITLKKTQYV